MNDPETNNSHRFLIARFNVDYIVGHRTVGGIEEALLNISIPETTGRPIERENEYRMDDVYNRIIDSIRNLPQAERKYAFRALSWIGYATRTLTAQELLAAICVEAKQYQLIVGNMYTLKNLLDICNGLVVTDQDEQAVRLVHFSVRNYLDRSKIIPGDTKETYRAIACSTYLSFDSLKEQRCSSQNLGNIIGNLPFLDYAANNLTSHLSIVEHGHYPETTSAVLKLLEDKGHRRAYCKMKRGIGRALEIPRLNLACAIGYEDAVRTLLEEADVDVNAKDANGGLTSLSWAVKMGHEAVVKCLLDDGRADQNCKDNNGSTPLSLIIEAGDNNGKILTLLLEKGVEVNFIYRAVSQSIDYLGEM